MYINNLRNVEIRNAGLGADKGVLPIMTCDEIGRSLGGASRFLSWRLFQRKIG
jgi:hypothetical protein